MGGNAIDAIGNGYKKASTYLAGFGTKEVRNIKNSCLSKVVKWLQVTHRHKIQVLLLVGALLLLMVTT